MTDTAGSFAVEYKPTVMERFWRKMGFRYHLGKHEPDGSSWNGWMQTRAGIQFDWRDRLRILISGRLEMTLTVHTDTPSPGKTHTRFDWQIKAPGEA